MNIEEIVFLKLSALKDEKYREFHCALMPTVDKETVLGVRVPDLRKTAMELSKEGLANEFLAILPHRFYEENNLHGLLINQIKDYDDVITHLDKFLPYVNNWATCDIIRPKPFKKNNAFLEEKIYEWMRSEHTYTARFGIEMLMCYYLDDHFKELHIQKVLDVPTDEYYVSMMVAWYLSFALVKHYQQTLPYISREYLDEKTLKRTVRKALDSYRITGEQKNELRKSIRT